MWRPSVSEYVHCYRWYSYRPRRRAAAITAATLAAALAAAAKPAATLAASREHTR